MTSRLPLGRFFRGMAFVGLGTWRFLVFNNVGQASLLENTGRCVSHIQEHLVEHASGPSIRRMTSLSRISDGGGYQLRRICVRAARRELNESIDTWFTLWMTSPVSRPVSELMTPATRATTTTPEGPRSVPNMERT